MNNRMRTRETIKDRYRETNIFLNRVITGFFLVFILLAVLLGRAVSLQIINHEAYSTLSEKNRIKIEPIAPTRGLIMDRNGVLLAENQSIYSLEITPEKVSDWPSTLSGLQQLLGITDEEVERFENNRRGQHRFRKVPLRARLNEAEVAKFVVNKHQYPGVSVEARLVRHYPYKQALAHALGYVGRIDERELENLRDPDNYKATSHIGKVGLEKFYESDLHGSIGRQEVETDVNGRVQRVLQRTDPVAGTDLQLHLDVRLQMHAATLLEGRRGSIIAIEPETGGVLAMVSNPGYDPNEFVTGISQNNYRELVTSPDRPLFNRALRGQYSPASTIKPHLAWLALESGQINPETSIYDRGWFVIPNREDHRYRDWKSWGHGTSVNVTDAIRESCDTFFYQLALNMGIDDIHAGMTQFGFGVLTGIDLGEEVPALMPSREWKQDARRLPWFPGETVITGIGQGFWTATPLQLANSAAVIANDGVRFQLQMVKAVGQADVFESRPAVMAYEQIEVGDGANLDLIKSAMLEVTSAPTGTARAAFADAQYSAAGKTGTAQRVSIAQDEEYDEEKVKERNRDNALYIGYAPYAYPKIAVAVVVENAGGGGSQAAPLARQVMDFYLGSEVRNAAR